VSAHVPAATDHRIGHTASHSRTERTSNNKTKQNKKNKTKQNKTQNTNKTRQDKTRQAKPKPNPIATASNCVGIASSRTNDKEVDLMQPLYPAAAGCLLMEQATS
jgi:hypothetical protein